MKKSLILAAGVISIGLLGACMQEEKPEAKVKETASAEVHKPETVSEEKLLENGEPDFSEDFENTVSREEAITPEMKAMVKDQYEYFSKLVVTYENTPGEIEDDAWLTEEVKSELAERAKEIEALMPTKNANLERDLYMALGELEDGLDYESGGSIWMPYRVFLGLNAGMNGIETKEEQAAINEEGNWTATFTDEEIGWNDTF
ncbi:hypothetical protein [Peribacillus sp. TH27]|uniref:hypothetical protein n=1 Tax=Peribacillus sp. TH27 TaxID=2798484 RepID=UPI0019121B39|nr:hypothetical protein [Peribacillus sp. TH27]MBK5458050.1 hypothetical protein [Peribacillus sp. TH27]